MIKRNPEVANQPLFFAKISEVNIRYSFTSYRNKYKIERNKECSSLNTGYGLSQKDSWFQGTRCSSSKLLLWLSPLDALCI